MALYVVATPIGNSEDLSIRAKETLTRVPLIIGEEAKESRRFLAKLGLRDKEILELNEHSSSNDIKEFTKRLQHEEACLISDCGTPGFCDPGADLVAACRKAEISVIPLPGASSLMTFLSVCGVRLGEFYFRGFLPAKSEERVKALSALKTFSMPVVLMDTPYRLGRTLQDLVEHFPSRRVVLGLNLTQDGEQVLDGKPAQLLRQVGDIKAEFILVVI